jgi:hypothetical protein
MLFVFAGVYAPQQADAKVVVVVGTHHRHYRHHRYHRVVVVRR